MARNGFFTFHDLYAGKPEYYYQHNNISVSSSTPVEFLTKSDTIDISFSDTNENLFPDTNDISISDTIIDASFLNTTDDLDSVLLTNIKSSNKFSEFIQSIPFAYFHWFLIGLAILFAILLAIILTCYCRNHCRKTKKSRKEKKQPFPNFYRYLASNRHANAASIYDSTTPNSLFSSSTATHSTTSKSTERLNKQLLRKGLDAVGSPHVPRIDISEIGSAGSFGSSATDLISEMKTRLNTRKSEPSLRKERLYETQRANIALDHESKRSSTMLHD